MLLTIALRPIEDPDLPTLFQQQCDPAAIHMAAFTAKDPTDRAAFEAHWSRIRAAEGIILRTILYGDEVAGYLASWHDGERRELSYWIGREYWGQGIATTALRAYLDEAVSERPVYARAAADNRGSIKVLEKCGFELVRLERGFAAARGKEIEEVLMVLGG